MVSILHIHQINTLSRQDFINNLVSLVPPGSAKSLHSPQFSDVIAWAGTSGLPAAFRSSYDIKHVAKKVTSQSPLKSRLKLRLNGLFWRNNPVKQYFPGAWTPFTINPKTGSENGQTEPVSDSE
jgi:hypothetical protein